MSGLFFVVQPRQSLYNRKLNLSLSILYQNVSGLRTKSSKFLSLLESSSSDLFAITETGCNESIQNAEITLPGYSILRCDRADGRKQGGVLLVSTPRFELRQVTIPDDINIDVHKFELICATVYSQNRFLVTCCVLYIPPQTDVIEYSVMFNILEKICVKYKNKVVILGDFNLFSCPNHVCDDFEYFVAFCEVVQCNKVPNCNGRQLDLVLSGLSGVVVCAGDEGLLPVDVYHPPLAVTVPTSSPLPQPAKLDAQLEPQNEILTKKWNFSKANFHQLYHLLALIDWDEMYSLCDPDLALNFFYSKIYEVFDICIPLKNKITNNNNRYTYPVWYTSDIIKDIQLKYRLHKIYKASKSPTDYEAFSRCRARVKVETALAHDRYRDRVQSHLAADPKAFWSYVRSKRGNSSQYNLNKDGQVLSDQECAQEFGRFFHSVYNPEPATLDADTCSETAEPSGAWVHLGCFEASEVRRALARLPPKRSVGPDGIPPFILRDSRMVLDEPLLHLFNVCTAAASFPDRWKLSRVVPVPKGSGGSEASDYRPVAVLCATAKVFEAAIHNSLYKQVNAHLSDAQHGFRPGRSTTGNLLNLMTQLVPAVDAGLQVDVAYLDFRKAFDTVDNDVLLSKLANKGFTPHTIKFFADYLRNRRQYVDCGGSFSEIYFTRSGVSQGTNLGPFLFILMVDDLPEVVKESTCLLFADDLKLIHVVKDIADHDTLQRDLARVTDWSQENKLYFNVSKCSVLSYTRAHTPRRHQYLMGGEPLQRVMEVRDLGVCFTADLQFRKHIVAVCKKAYRSLGFLLRQANQFTNMSALRALYEALVKSHLQYNAAIWSPSEAKYNTMLERIQNKYIRFMYHKMYGVYPGYPLLYPTLFVLGMVGYTRLEVKRELALATYLFKVIRGKICNPDILQAIKLWVPDEYVNRRRRPRLLGVPKARTNLLRRAPFTRALCTLNAVAMSLDLFSCALNDFTLATTRVLCYSDLHV